MKEIRIYKDEYNNYIIKFCFENNSYVSDLKSIIENTMLDWTCNSVRYSFAECYVRVPVVDIKSPYFSRGFINYVKEKRLYKDETLFRAEIAMQKIFSNSGIPFTRNCSLVKVREVSDAKELHIEDTDLNLFVYSIDINTNKTCDCCYNQLDSVKEYVLDGHKLFLCDNCHTLKTRKCSICGCKHLVQNMQVLDGHFVCQECMNKLLKKYKVSIYYCTICREYHTKQNFGKNRVNEREWCCDRTAQNLHRCEFCGVLYTSLMHSFSGTKMCTACYHKKEKYLIKSYHNDPVPEFYITNGDGKNFKMEVPPSNGNGQFYGVELEVDSGGQRDDMSEPTIKLLNEEVYAMRDGSLENGFEIVTHPHSETALYNMPWKEAFEFLVKQGYRSHDINTCGLHLHCNRSIFGASPETQKLNIIKLMYFFEAYRLDFIKLSRREVQHINRWAKFYNDGVSIKDLNYYKNIYENYNRSPNHNDRYKAINLCKKKTIEFRLMRGTLNLDTFFATLDVLITISKNASKVPIENLLNKELWLKGLKEETKKYLKDNEILQGDDIKVEKQVSTDDSLATATTTTSASATFRGGAVPPQVYNFTIADDGIDDQVVSFGEVVSNFNDNDTIRTWLAVQPIRLIDEEVELQNNEEEDE